LSTCLLFSIINIILLSLCLGVKYRRVD
jgi:hypothetical protein